MEQLAGTYEGSMPGDMFPYARLQIAEDGSVTGIIGVGPGLLFPSPITGGEATIPDPGKNQFQLEFRTVFGESNWPNSWSSIGTSRGDGIYLITKHEVDDEEHRGTFDWVLSRQ